MTEEQKPADTPAKWPKGVFILGPAIAIGVALWVIFGAGSGSNDKAPEAQPQAVQSAPATGAEPIQPSTNIDAGPPVAAAPGAVPTPQIHYEDQLISFTATFPDASPNDPIIASLRKDAESYLSTKKAEAKAQFEENKKTNEPWLQPWDFEIVWTYTARAGGLVSLFGVSSEFEGGAHPSYTYDTFIGRSTGEQLKFGDMLALKHSPSPAMAVAMCEALKGAKKNQIGEETIFSEPIVCVGPKANAALDQAKIALAPSDENGRIGGVYAYFEPYVVGAYAEGRYRFAVQQKIFAEDLNPEFRPLFAGEAPPLKD